MWKNEVGNSINNTIVDDKAVDDDGGEYALLDNDEDEDIDNDVYEVERRESSVELI